MRVQGALHPAFSGMVSPALGFDGVGDVAIPLDHDGWCAAVCDDRSPDYRRAWYLGWLPFDDGSDDHGP